MIWLIIVAVIIAVSLLRVGATAEYSDDGILLLAHVGFITKKLFPKKQKNKKRGKKEKRKPREYRKKERRDERAAAKKPGLSFEFRTLLDEVVNVLGKIKRRLLIKELTVLYVQAGGDPAKMATNHGVALTALGLTQATLECFFRVKRYNLHTSVDFIADKSRVYVHATFTIAVWEVISIGFAVLMLILRSKKPKEKTKAEENTPEEVEG